jgi:hypothetical protein
MLAASIGQTFAKVCELQLDFRHGHTHSVSICLSLLRHLR